MIRITARVLAILGAILALVLVACQTEAETTAPAEIPRAAILVIGTIGVDAEEKAGKEEEFRQLVDYVGRELGAYGIRKGELVIAESPVKMATLMRQGKVDIFIDSVFPAFVVNKLAGSEPFLSRWKSGVEKYHAVIFTKSDSGITSLDDLKGKMITFAHPASTSRYFLPKSHLLERGYTLTEKSNPTDQVAPDEIGYYFSDYRKVNTLEDVLSGVAAAASMKESDLDESLEELGEARGTVRIISNTIDVFRHLVVVRRDLDPELKVALQEVLVAMDKTPEGQVVLKEFNKTKKFALFEPDGDEVFQAMRQHVELVEKEIVQQ